jgi:hypothetical protein
MRELVAVTLIGGQVINAHHPDKCKDQSSCSIHKPSQHHMREWPQNWRMDGYLMERICPHGIGHPDPDHMLYMMTSGQYDPILETHGCDGCCKETHGEIVVKEGVYR